MTHPPCDRVLVEFELNRRPHPKGRPRFDPRSKRAYTDKETRAYEDEVRDACKDAMFGRDPYTGPVELVCLFEQKDYRAADTDNLLKAVSDAINGTAYQDDRQVSHLRAVRVTGAPVDRVSVAVLTLAKDPK